MERPVGRRNVARSATITVAPRAARSKRLQRLRSERVERSFAHMRDSGGARRSWLRGLAKVQKRYLIAAVARNLGLIMRKVFQIGTPKGLQAEGGLVSFTLSTRFNNHRRANLWHDVQPLPRPLPTPCAVAA